MEIIPIKTRALLPPKDDLLQVISQSLPARLVKERSVLAVTSKVAAIWQGRCVKIEPGTDKVKLAEQEADAYAWVDSIFGGKALLTLKNHLLVSKAGIDESNANGYYALWPEHPFDAALRIRNFMRQHFEVRNFGVVITDSRSVPSRLGSLGVAIAYCGFSPLKDYRGTKDIFGRTFEHSRANAADALAAAAVLVMGEGAEQTPLAIINDIPGLEFQDPAAKVQDEVAVDMEGDIYGVLMKSIPWKKNDSRKK